MKKIILSIALLSFSFVFAQKKEIAEAYKSIESNDLSATKSNLASAETLMGGKTSMLEPSVLEQYYYAKGALLIKEGKTSEGASYLAKINDLEKSKIYYGKDSQKNKVYFVGKAAADASGISGLKEETYTPTTKPKLEALINPILQKAGAEAINQYKAEKYVSAGDKFLEVYNLLKAVGQVDQQYLYNSGLSYALGKDNAKAIEIFDQLIAANYTGVETTYTAKDKSGKVISFDNKSTWEVMKKDPSYSDFKEQTSKSIEEELFETDARLKLESGKYDDALATIEKGLKKFPNNAQLLELQGTTFYKSGKTNEFVSNLKNQVAKNPKDAVSWYNLGVLQSKEPGSTNDAIASFKKAVEIDPTMKNGYQNLVYTIIGDDDKAIADYKKLLSAGKTDEANKVMDARRKRFSDAIPYAEKLYALDPNNKDVVSLLKGLYLTTKNEAKAKEFKAKEEALKNK